MKPLSLNLRSSSSLDISTIRVSTSDLLTFTKQMAVLVSSGIQLHIALESLNATGTDKLSLQVLPHLNNFLTRGGSLAASMSKFPRTFPPTYIALVRSGEETGRLHFVLEELTNWLERRDRLNKVVKKALTYPVFVAVLTITLTLVLFRTVVPSILQTVVDLGVALPWPTRLLLTIVDIVGSPISWFLAALAVGGLLRYFSTEDGQRRWIAFCCSVPALGQVLIWSASSRFANAMAMLVASGVDMLRACRISSEASGLPLMQQDCARLISELSTGEPLSRILHESPLYPALLPAMLSVGEESGDLPKVLRKCGQMLEEDAVEKVEAFTALLEPVLLGLLSAGVGFIVIAVMLPISAMVSAL